MSQISVNHVTFYYEGSFDNIFEDVSFQIDTDWKLGFVARNGRGKTTFLRLLLGEYEYRGSITSPEVFDYFPFSIADVSKNTLDIIMELYPEHEFWMLCRELSLLSVDAEVLYRPFSTLSNGEQTKVMLAVLFSTEHRFLLIDEPTNHLDAPTRAIVRDYLKGKKGFILVSHDRDFLDSCIDHVLVINKTNLEVVQGNFSSWWENKQRQDAFELAENEKLKKEVGRLQASAKLAGAWAANVEASKIGKNSEKYEKNIDTRAYVGEKSRRMSQRRKNLEHRRERAVEEKSALLKNIETADSLKLIMLKHHKEVLVSLEDLRICYDTKELPPVLFQIKQGDRVALQGANGCGKSSIIKAILRECQAALSEESAFCTHGKLDVASGLVVSYLPQDTGHLNGTLAEFAEQQSLDFTLFLAVLRKLDFSRIQFEKRMEDYSGGQKKKVLLAASLCTPAHLYIWDEPLNFIDIFSRIQIEELILEFQPTLLFVEHDKVFTDRVATKIVTI